MIIEVLLFCFTLYFIYLTLKPKRPDKFPPGPENYPIVGGSYIFDKSTTGPIAIQRIGEKYGPICGLYLGKNLSILVNGYETVKEVLSREEFSSRPDLVVRTDSNGKLMSREKRNLGVMFANDNTWKVQRRFMIRTLRDFGFGKTSLEGLIHEEIEDCMAELQKKVEASPNQVVDLQDIFAVSIINILWAIVSGVRYKHDNENFKMILKKLYDSFRSGSSPVLRFISDYPWLRHLPYFKQHWKLFIAGRTSVTELLNETIANHERRKDRKENPQDFIDLFLSEIEVEKEKGIEITTFTKEQLVEVGLDMFSAGSESTSNSLAFAILYMINYPEVRKKVQKELDFVFGNKQPSYSEKSNVPYTEAVLSELFRIASIAGLTVPHFTAVNTTLNNYNIPKGTLVMVNLHSVHNDKQYWNDPENFRPERFLNSEGKFVPSERMFAFGYGKRICPGEILARANYFLFFTTFMLNFDFEAEEGAQKPSTVPLDGFTQAPQPFRGKVVKRVK